MINGSLWSPHSSRVDGEDRSAPSSYLLIRPYLGNLVRRLEPDFGVHGGRIWHEALHHDQAAWIGVELRIVPPCAVEPLVNGVETIDLGWRCEILGYSCPLLWNWLTKFLLPLSGRVEAVPPVCDLLNR